MSPKTEEILELFDNDESERREIEKDVRNRLFQRILDEEVFSTHVDLTSKMRKEEYAFAICANICGFIQLQARVCTVDSIHARGGYQAPSLMFTYSHSHVLSLKDKERNEVEISLDRRTWGKDEVSQRDAEKFAIHLDNLCYSLKQLQDS